MTSTRVVVLAGTSALVIGCGPGPNTTVNSCTGLAVSIFCSPAPPLDTGPTDMQTGTEALTPIAVCEVDRAEAVLPVALFAFDGTPSYSPEGLDVVGYEWSVLSAPGDSLADMRSLTGPTSLLEADVIGAYEVQLTVLNELGLRSEEPCIIHVLAEME